MGQDHKEKDRQRVEEWEEAKAEVVVAGSAPAVTASARTVGKGRLISRENPVSS